MKKILVSTICSAFILSITACGSNIPTPITFENETEMLSYLSTNKWKYNGSDADSSWIVISDSGFGEFSDFDNSGCGQYITMSPQDGAFTLNNEKYIISSVTGDLVKYSNPKENYKVNLSTPDFEIGSIVLKNYTYSKRNPNGDCLVSVQVTNTGTRTYKELGFDITLSDNENNSIVLETDLVDLEPGKSASCSAYSENIPSQYTNIKTTIKQYTATK